MTFKIVMVETVQQFNYYYVNKVLEIIFNVSVRTIGILENLIAIENLYISVIYVQAVVLVFESQRH